MATPDPKRLLFFASETAVLGVIVAAWYHGQRAVYVEPIQPVFCLGFLGLFVFSFGCMDAKPTLANVGFATLGLAVLWGVFVPVGVE